MSSVSEEREGSDRAQCSPCRGTGKVISGLGGTPHDLRCPWCEGTGEFKPGRDAQQNPGEARPN